MKMRDSWLLLFDGYLPKPLTADQTRLRNLGWDCIDELVSSGVYPATATNFVCDLLEPKVRGFAKWQYGDLLI
jgi:hypothetical protein